jgi:hypothetical protein
MRTPGGVGTASRAAGSKGGLSKYPLDLSTSSWAWQAHSVPSSDCGRAPPPTCTVNGGLREPSGGAWPRGSRLSAQGSRVELMEETVSAMSPATSAVVPASPTSWSKLAGLAKLATPTVARLHRGAGYARTGRRWALMMLTPGPIPSSRGKAGRLTFLPGSWTGSWLRRTGS